MYWDVGQEVGHETQISPVNFVKIDVTTEPSPIIDNPITPHVTLQPTDVHVPTVTNKFKMQMSTPVCGGNDVTDLGEPAGVSDSGSSQIPPVWSDLTDFRASHKKNLIIGHLNINSLRYKFMEVNAMLSANVIDIFYLSETKLDSSFPLNQFNVHGFAHYRNDRNQHGGGILCYIRNDIPHRRRRDLEAKLSNGVESMVLEVIIRHEKWLFIGIYKPPVVHVNNSITGLSDLLNHSQGNFKSTYLLGDININMLDPPSNFNDLIELYGLNNVIKDPTCFKSDSPTLIDVIFTDTPRRIGAAISCATGISDFHNIVCACTKVYAPKMDASKIKYRTLKNFDNEAFIQDLHHAPFHVSQIFDDVSDSYDFVARLYTDILDDHAPIKTGNRRRHHAPFMHSELRKAKNVKGMLWRRYNECKNSRNWKSYTKQRNLVTKLRKQAINSYSDKNCNDVGKKKFWSTIKPFMSSNYSVRDDCISLHENGQIINQQSDVCELLNQHFATVANDIGLPDHIQPMETLQEIVDSYESHESISNIKSHGDRINLDVFSFSPVSQNDVFKELASINERKSAGYDQIPARVIKLSKDALVSPITSLINMSFEQSLFPDSLKMAELAPVFKKDDKMNKNNFRPVSVLPCISKVFEHVYCNQMMMFFNEILSKFLAAFRKGYNCETVLVTMIEERKKALSHHKVVGAMLIDLSKAFDCLPHRLLVAKLHAYGLSEKCCKLVMSYLMNRKQRVKLGDTRSDWIDVLKGVPQGSILGPILFNVFINDIFYTTGNLYNYADDNTICSYGDDVSEVKSALEKATLTAMKWFKDNYMKVNPDKFQAIVLGNKDDVNDLSFDINGSSIKPTKCVKLLGVHIDDKLSFDSHISIICAQAARQLNSLHRISKFLNPKPESWYSIVSSYRTSTTARLFGILVMSRIPVKWRRFRREVCA